MGVVIIDMCEPAKSAPAPKKGFKKAVTKAQKKDSKKRKHSRKESMPSKSHGRRSVVGYSPWGRKESDTTERLNFSLSYGNLERWY